MKLQEGYIYILIHPIYQPDFLKIGHTLRTPQERANELTKQAGTALVGNFLVAYEEKVQDSFSIEQIVHKRLKAQRASNSREFFQYSLKEAIDIIRTTIDDVKNQKTIEFDAENPRIWWSNLDIVWKLVFRAHISTSKTPEKEELMEGLFTIINYCRDTKIRKLVARFLEKKNHRSFLMKWFDGLSLSEQKIIKNHVPHLLDSNEIDTILKLKKLDCSGNLLIQDLTPLRYLKELTFLDCSNTSAGNLESLKHLTNLQSLRINHLTLSSLTPLYGLQELSEIISHGTTIKDESLSELRNRMPQCTIQEDVFD